MISLAIVAILPNLSSYSKLPPFNFNHFIISNKCLKSQTNSQSKSLFFDGCAVANSSIYCYLYYTYGLNNLREQFSHMISLLCNFFLIFIIHSYLIYTSIDIDGAASLIRKGNKSLKYRNQCHLAVKNRKIGQRASYTRGIDGELGILNIYILSSDISTFGRDFVSNVLRCFQDDDCRG